MLRLVSVDKEKVYSAVVWSTMYYQDFSNYYATGWGTATPIGRAREVTTIAVETLLFDVAKGGLVWGSVTESTNPKNVQTYISGLAGEISRRSCQRDAVACRRSR